MNPERFTWTDEDIEWVEPRAAGGTGSGNFGHAGRPGEIGGSSESIGQTLDNRGVSTALRMQFSGPEEVKLARAMEALRGTAKRLDFPLEKVRVEVYQRGFDVGGRSFKEAGHFSPGTGEITLNARDLATHDTADAEIMFAHEVNHRDWNDVATTLGLEGGGPPGLDETDWPPSAQTVRDIIGEKGQILKREDGVSDYSRAYWRDVPKAPEIVSSGDHEHPWLDNNTGEMMTDVRKAELIQQADVKMESYDQKFTNAVNETLAVIAQQETGRALGKFPDGKKTFDPSPTWRELYVAVKATAKELRNTEIMTRGGARPVV